MKLNSKTAKALFGWGVALLLTYAPPASPSGEVAPTTRHKIVASYGNLPLSFEANQGQADSRVKFLSRGSGYTLFLTPSEAVLALRKDESRTQKTEGSLSTESEPKSKIENPNLAVLRMKLVGANPQPRSIGLNELPGKVNYFTGNDPNKWRTNVPTYAKVQYQDVYPGIDLVYYGNQRQLEYDFIVKPGTDPETIKLAFDGVDSV